MLNSQIINIKLPLIDNKTIIVDCSTIDIHTAKKLHSLCNDKNVEGFYTQSIIEDKSIFICKWDGCY